MLVLSTLLYGAETWSLKKTDENRLQTFEMSCLRRILGVTRLDRIRNTEIRRTLNVKLTVIEKIAQKRLRYFGHVQRMPPTRFPKIALEGRINGSRPRGRPPKRWIDCIKFDCSQRGVSTLGQAVSLARERLKWREILKWMPTLNPPLE